MNEEHEEIQREPKKPTNPLFRRFIIVVLGVCVALFLVAFLTVVSHGTVAPVNQLPEQQLQKPRTASTGDVAQFGKSPALHSSGDPYTGGVVPPDSNPYQEDPSIPPPTKAQERAMRGGDGGNQVSPAEERRKKRETALAASTLAIDFSSQPTQQTTTEKVSASSPEQKREPAGDTASTPAREKVENAYPFDSSTGRTYRIFEGTILETVLTNRINGAAVGPIDCMVTTDIYSHDHQILLIPQGTRILGSVTAVNSGEQQRMFVAFHRAIMPDGYSLSLDQFKGLDVVGQVGLRDIVNHHYLSIFGASLAIAGIGGLAQAGNGYSGFGYDPATEIRSGVSQQMAQESMQILDRFLNQIPVFLVRERTRVKIKIEQDLLLPAYSSHTMGIL